MEAHLPEGWPPFAVPDGATLVSDDSEPGVRRISFTTARSGPALAFFHDTLTQLGWTVRTIPPEAAGEVDLEIEGHGFWGQIEIDASGFRVQLVD